MNDRFSSLTQLRIDRKLSTELICRELRINFTTYRKLEQGLRVKLSINTISRLSKIFNISDKELISIISETRKTFKNRKRIINYKINNKELINNLNINSYEFYDQLLSFVENIINCNKLNDIVQFTFNDQLYIINDIYLINYFGQKKFELYATINNNKYYFEVSYPFKTHKLLNNISFCYNEITKNVIIKPNFKYRASKTAKQIFYENYKLTDNWECKNGFLFA